MAEVPKVQEEKRVFEGLNSHGARQANEILLSSLISPFPMKTATSVSFHGIEQFYGVRNEWVEDQRGPIHGDVPVPNGENLFKVRWNNRDKVLNNADYICDVSGLSIGQGKDGTVWLGFVRTIDEIPEVWIPCPN